MVQFEKIVIPDDIEVFFTSDIHYMHVNLTEGCSRWSREENSGLRPFKTVEEMSEHMINQINKYVPKSAIWVNLGDLSFSGIQNIWNCISQINCKQIIHTFGNHDEFIINNRILPNCKYDKNKNIVDGEPTPYIREELVLAQELFYKCGQGFILEYRGDKFIIQHYPADKWELGYYLLHGHTHGEILKLRNRLDVGIDSANMLIGEYKPFSYYEIKELLK